MSFHSFWSDNGPCKNQLKFVYRENSNSIRDSKQVNAHEPLDRVAVFSVLEKVNRINWFGSTRFIMVCFVPVGIGVKLTFRALTLRQS